MDSLPQAKDLMWLLAIVALALVLRIVGLNGPLWYDEIVTIGSHLRLDWGEMLHSYAMNHHYLYSMEAKSLIAVFGEHPWVVRLPAMLFGVLGIAAMWWLARMVAGTFIAHVTALLMALSYHHIWFSQNARGYTELAFFGTLGTIIFLYGMARPRWPVWFIYGGVLGLAVFTHLTGAFIFAAHGLVWLALVVIGYFQRTLRSTDITWPAFGFVIGGLFAIVLYSPVIPSLLESIGGVAGTSAVDVMVEYQNPLWTLLEGVRTAVGSGGPLVTLVAVAIVVLAIFGGRQAHEGQPLFAPIVAVHIVLTLLLLVALGMRVWPRFFFADIGFLLLLIVLGVRFVSDWFEDRIMARPFGIDLFRAALVAMVLVSAGLAARNYTAPKQNLAGAVAYVESVRTANERVVALGQAGQPFTGYFGTGWTWARTSEAYNEAFGRPGPLTVVVAFPDRTFRTYPQLELDTQGDLKLARRFRGTLGDGAVLVFRRE